MTTKNKSRRLQFTGKRFTTAWATIDPDALHFIPKEKLRDLLGLLGPPAGLKASASNIIYLLQHDDEFNISFVRFAEKSSPSISSLSSSARHFSARTMAL